MANTNRRKTQGAAVAISSTGASGSISESDAAANADRVTFFFLLVAITAGNVTLTIEASPNDGVSWFALATAETTGNTGALTAAGNYHISANAPFGVRVRLTYTIVTGPITAVVYPCFEKGGSVY